MFVRTSPTRPKRSGSFSKSHSSGSGATVTSAGVPPEKTNQLRHCIRRGVPSNLIRWSGLRVGPEPFLHPWVAWGRRIFKGSRNLHESNHPREPPTSLGKRCFGATRRAGRYLEAQIPRAPSRCPSRTGLWARRPRWFLEMSWWFWGVSARRSDGATGGDLVRGARAEGRT